jgi:hypothetical protein
MKTLVVIVLIAVAVSPALAGWGIPWIAWLDPGDGPGPPHPDDPGDGPVLTPPATPAPTVEIDRACAETIRLAYNTGLGWAFAPEVAW